MQNAQNNEIQQRVINLVELYRTKVGRESQIAKDAKEEKAYWDNANIDAAIQLHEEGFKGPIGFSEVAPDMPDEWVNTLRVNDHLLGHFYSVVAGKDADTKVLSQFLPDYYDSSVFTSEEEEFLRSHFKEMVNYIIQTPCDDLDIVNHHDGKDWQLIPIEVLALIKSRVQIPTGSTIYNPFSGFGQMTSIYPDCYFYCEDSYSSFNKRWNAFSEKCHKESNIVLGTHDVNLMSAWMKVAFFANSIDAMVIEDGMIPSKYDSVVSFIPRIPNAIPGKANELDLDLPADSEIINKVIASYEKLPQKGKMVLVLPKDYLWASDSYYSLRPLWKKLIEDKSLSEIIQLPWVMSNNLHRENFCLVIAEKGRKDNKTTLIDARFAVHDSEKKNFNKAFDLSSFKDMLTNSGKEVSTGLLKMVCLQMENLNPEILVPQIYVVEKPFAEENPQPLSKLGAMVYTRISSLKINLPEDTPWVELGDLFYSYKGPLNISALKKAECPNNPVFIEGSEDYAFSKSGKFIDDFWSQVETNKGSRVYDYRRCIYLDGTKDAVLLRLSEKGIGIAIFRATGKAIAVGDGIIVICPKDGVDAITLAALLKLHIVIRQMLAYKDFGLVTHLDDILVPTDKRIILDEIHRLTNEQETYKKQEELLATKKTEYINEVRMRKHDMGQYIFELVNIEDLMRYYIENREKEPDFCTQLEGLLDNFKSSLGELSILLDNLSKEEEFGTPENFNLDEFLSQLNSRHKADGFKIVYSRDESSIIRYNQKLRNDDLVVLDDYVPEIVNDLDDYVAEDTNDLDEYVPEIVNDLDDYVAEDTNDLDDYVPEIVNDLDDYVAEDTNDLDEYEPKCVGDSQYYSSKESVDVSHDYSSTASIDEIGDYVVEDVIKYNRNLSKVPLLYIAPNDMQRAVNNIIDNARKHGFTDSETKDNKIEVRLSIDCEQNMFVIDFRNNGKPLPEGMNKMRYGIKGEKAGKTAGTGIGGSYVKKFVEHYGGDYDVFMEGDWTVIRIVLPIK